jgi:hypothetical protein
MLSSRCPHAWPPLRCRVDSTRRHATVCQSSSGAADSAARYAARGVSASKEDVHAAIARLDKGLFPGAFCKVRIVHS